MSGREVTRRRFLKGLAVATGGTILAACQPQVVKETVVVERVVDRPVVETVVVEKAVDRPVVETDTAHEEKSSRYSESPMLRERVERGELPPVEERLPDNPLVVTPIEQIGRYDSEPKESESP